MCTFFFLQNSTAHFGETVWQFPTKLNVFLKLLTQRHRIYVHTKIWTGCFIEVLF